MIRFNHKFTILLLVALILGACQPIQLVAPATQGQPHQPRSDAPPYAVRGSYPVGARDFVINTPDRPIAVSVWYPALNPAAKPEAVTYTLDFPTNDFPEFTIAGRALRDAQPDYANGPYPLLLHIHAAWSTRQEMAYLVEHLASYGFVVIAPAMTDNWGMLFTSVYQSEIVRARDASRTLDFAEELTAADGQLAGLIDLDHIAASGWSWGGQVALELAGARIDLNDWLATYCKAYPEDVDCQEYPKHLNDMATLAGLAAPPEGLWPDWRDPRVDAIVPFAPGVSMFPDAGIQSVQIPVLLLLGSADDSVGPMFAMRQTFEKLPSPAKTRVLIENASHLVYFNNCTASPELIAAEYTWVCSDPVWDMDRAHDLVNHFATAFLLTELKGDAEAAKALAPENVAFPGIQYETTEFGEAQ